MQNQLAARMLKPKKYFIIIICAKTFMLSSAWASSSSILPFSFFLDVCERDGKCWFPLFGSAMFYAAAFSMFFHRVRKSFMLMFRIRKMSQDYDSIYLVLVRGWKVKVEQFILDTFMGFLCLSSAKYLYN